MTASVERTQTRDLFSRFVPDSVVAQVLERADSQDDVRLGGELLSRDRAVQRPAWIHQLCRRPRTF